MSIKLKELTEADCKLHPQSFQESRGIWILENFNRLRDDFLAVFCEVENGDYDESYEYNNRKLGRTLCDCLAEATRLISTLNSSINFNALKKNNVDYVALAIGKYIERKENDLAYISNRASYDTCKYAASTKARDLRAIGCIIDAKLDESPELYIHLTTYMANIK